VKRLVDWFLAPWLVASCAIIAALAIGILLGFASLGYRIVTGP